MEEGHCYVGLESEAEQLQSHDRDHDDTQEDKGEEREPDTKSWHPSFVTKLTILRISSNIMHPDSDTVKLMTDFFLSTEDSIIAEIFRSIMYTYTKYKC